MYRYRLITVSPAISIRLGKPGFSVVRFPARNVSGMSDIINKVVMKLKGLSRSYHDDLHHELSEPHPATVAVHRRRTKKNCSSSMSWLPYWSVCLWSHQLTRHVSPCNKEDSSCARQPAQCSPSRFVLPHSPPCRPLPKITVATLRYPSKARFGSAQSKPVLTAQQPPRLTSTSMEPLSTMVMALPSSPKKVRLFFLAQRPRHLERLLNSPIP